MGPIGLILTFLERGQKTKTTDLYEVKVMQISDSCQNLVIIQIWLTGNQALKVIVLWLYWAPIFDMSLYSLAVKGNLEK